MWKKSSVYVPKKTKKRFEDKLKRLTNRNRGVSMEYIILKLNQLIQGWGNYFKVGDIKKHAKLLDAHIRRRLKTCRWKEWKKIRTKYKNLIKLGISKKEAWKNANSRKSYWRMSNTPVLDKAMNIEYWIGLGLKPLSVVIS
jgi:RNA-directed DNA polymerase